LLKNENKKQNGYFKIKFGDALFLIKLFLLSTPLLITIFIFSYLWKEPSYTEGIFTGIREGCLYILRFLNIIIVNFMIISCTDSREILTTLRALKIPKTISHIITHTINLLPRLSQEIRIIAEAQTVRGMKWKNLWKPSQWLPFALPTVLSVMRYSEQMAISLELKGGIDNSTDKLPKFKLSDIMVGIICISIMIFSITQYKFKPTF